MNNNTEQTATSIKTVNPADNQGMVDYLKKDDKLIDIKKLPARIQKEIYNSAVFDIYKARATEDIKSKTVDLDKYIKRFIKSQSNHTGRTYGKAIDDFKNYLDRVGIESMLLARAEHIDMYIEELKGLGLKPNTIRLKLSAVSSFYSKLKRYNHISINPVHGAKLPAKQYKKANLTGGSILTDTELEAIKRFASGNLRLAIELMSTHGLRVGALEHIKFTDSHFTYKTKGGKEGRRTTTQSIANLIKLTKPVFKKNTVQVGFMRLCKRLVANDLIKNVYSCHDLRHWYAVNQYRANKDIYQLQKLLDHASISVTEVYLQSISTE